MGLYSIPHNFFKIHVFRLLTFGGKPEMLQRGSPVAGIPCRVAAELCSRGRTGEGEGGRERERSTWFDWFFSQKFQLKLKISEYESCSKLQTLHFSFQAQVRLKPSLEIKFKCLWIWNLALFNSWFKFFFHFCVATLKTLNMKVVQHLKPYNFYFRQKFIRPMI